ncbi:MAG: Htur_1727 family rSAM-partnered candidate RiPP [Haloarculaceae archaeon]
MEPRLDHEVDAPRGATTREWEVFVRESDDEPLVHAGSVSAPDAAVAREQATTLFDWASAALWLCPADKVRRYQAAALSLAADDGGSEAAEGDAP